MTVFASGWMPSALCCFCIAGEPHYTVLMFKGLDVTWTL